MKAVIFAPGQYVKIVLAFTMMVLFMVGCSAANGSQTTTAEADEVTFQMGWIHEYSAAGLYAAVANDRFTAENLSVQINEGGFGEQGYIDPITQVSEGSADFGATSAISLIQARAAGVPVVAIAAEIQRSPFALISLAEDNIIRPADLVGKRVAVNDGGAAALYNALLLSQGLNPDDIETISRTTFGIDPLTNDEVDVIGGWIINEAILVREAGLEPTSILLSDYGINDYTSLIFTTEKIINEKPDVVERFLRAYLQGIADVIADPEEAVTLVMQYNDTLVAEEQERRLQAWLPLINPAGSTLGAMQTNIWEQIHQIMLDHGILAEPITIEEAYDLRFLEAINQE
ncbi:MAG: ABC transporter substrate-binding protein [Ardenticatenaceae bacterium]|nr:ABC transporter substrate-binding protein [Ardenticatenaceae bacterium]